jgi:hypothetical protein
MSVILFSKRPWLLVWVAFLVLIAAWVVTYRISRRAPSDRLTPAQEAALLQGRKTP